MWVGGGCAGTCDAVVGGLHWDFGVYAHRQHGVLLVVVDYVAGSCAGFGNKFVGARHADVGDYVVAHLVGEDFKTSEMAGIMLIGTGLALLFLFGWLASRRGGG